MTSSSQTLSASDAARRLGVSIKALRLYEQHGLLTPGRSAAAYRLYDAAAMARAADVVALRALGLSLAEVGRVLNGDSHSLAAALASHETAMDHEVQGLLRKLDKVRSVRAGLARGQMPADGELTRLLDQPAGGGIAFELPWPWGGERFELRDIRPLNFIIGSLGSGKTRLARCIAGALPGAAFLGLDRLEDAASKTAGFMNAHPALASRILLALTWLVDEGATQSDALVALLCGLEEGDGPENEGPESRPIVIDMVEQGLDQSSQEALIAWLRVRAKSSARPLFLMTRSCAILNLADAGPHEAIILCPANHSPPVRVLPYPGAAGYEAVALCLASPKVRERVAREPEVS